MPRVRAGLERIRRSPGLAVTIAAGVVLVIAWIGWAIYVGNDRGASEGVAVLIAWAALLASAALVALPFVVLCLVVRSSGSRGADGAETGKDDGEVTESG